VSKSFVETHRESLPVVPLRDMVVFPHMMAPFIVGRESSVHALEIALATAEKRIFLVAQRDPKVDEPMRDDLYDFGVVARVVQNLKLPNGNIKVMVEGLKRGKLMDFEEREGTLWSHLETYDIQYPMSEKLQLFVNKVLGAFEQYAKLSQHLAFEGLLPTLKLDEPDRLTDTLASHLTVPTAEKQAMLELLSPYERLQRLLDLLDVEMEKMNLDRRINVQVKKQMEKAQKEYYLNEKIKAIHQELGKKDDRSDEIAELKAKIEKAGLPKAVAEKAEQELKRLESMPPVSAEATVSRNYIDWIASVPWKKTSRELKDLGKAEEILNEEHFGLQKVKERILEFLAVRQLTTETPASILCFVGPPGVGKSSLASSIARAVGRKFVRLSLGRRARRGRDPRAPAHVHRRLPRADHPDDEEGRHGEPGLPARRSRQDVDGLPRRSVGSAARSARSGAEHAFVDHFLDVEYDLSKVMFIATANVLHPIPRRCATGWR
jgi:ATP-dependent Lon protease